MKKTKKTIRTIRTIKKKISLTTRENFQDILQGKFSEIYNNIEQTFKIAKDHKIKSTKLSEIKGFLEEQFFTKIGDIFTNNYKTNNYKTNIQYKFSIKCDKNQLGKLNSAYNITVNDEYPSLLIFREHNPLESNILRAIFYKLSDSEFETKKLEFNEWLKVQEGVDYDSTISSINTFTNEKEIDNRVKLFTILDILSSYTNTNLILFSQTFNKLESNMENIIGNWFSSKKILSNINKKPLSIIFLISNKDSVIFEPVILIDIKKKTISNVIQSNLTEPETHIDNKFYHHLIYLITNKSLKLLGKPNSSTIIENKMKLDSLSEIYFNPYDKNVELPIIELELDGSKKEYLIGNLYGKFRNIYSKKDNNLVGKVILNGDTNTLDVYWCEGYPK